MITLTAVVVENIIRKLLNNDENYRTEIIALIDAQFLEYVVKFVGKVFQAKSKDETVTLDWYKEELLSLKLSAKEVAINSGLNMKTIKNAYGNESRQTVLDASFEHYETLRRVIEELTEQQEVDITLTIKLNKDSKDSVGLNINESLVVINTIAVMRAALRGGVWSTAGKQVEQPLMITLCKLFQVPPEHFDQRKRPKTKRQIDFFLIDNNSTYHPCEVKLMGQGNPESIGNALVRAHDAAQEGKRFVFVADTLSEDNRQDLRDVDALWVELNTTDGYRKFEQILEGLSIPHTKFEGNLVEAVDRILLSMANEKVQEMAKEAADPFASNAKVRKKK